MRARVLTTTIILILNLILQSTIFQHIRIADIMPNTSIIIIISYAILRGSTEGAIVGCFSGLLTDIFFGNSIGFYGFLGMMTGYLCGRSFHNLYRENYILPIMISATAVFIYESIVYFTGFLFNGNTNYIYFLVKLIVPEMVYTGIFSMIIYRLLFALNDWLEEKEKYRYRLF
ncbi:MAG: rod shape-determining protein MreD [Tyzzerella sp.]|uniref:Rod shape-determining protein MreD n=1 Tax=Candidatus Fimicola merdigallinarum TaxID=2840819 RepID=A0A9D9DWU6_9FIRM|nr:rod shape-determining protein MreD [Candidatus Fimicola merdigallinarum]